MGLDATKIAYVELSGVKSEDGKLVLEYKEDVLNHLETIHASAQFTLAETASGVCLQDKFGELEGRAIPILRSATIKYSKPATKKISAFATVKGRDRVKFMETFLKRGRASIDVDVEVKDCEGVSTCRATFVWFVQSIG